MRGPYAVKHLDANALLTSVVSVMCCCHFLQRIIVFNPTQCVQGISKLVCTHISLQEVLCTCTVVIKIANVTNCFLNVKHRVKRF